MRIAEAFDSSELAQLARGLDAAWFVPRASTLTLIGGEDPALQTCRS